MKLKQLSIVALAEQNRVSIIRRGIVQIVHHLSKRIVQVVIAFEESSCEKDQSRGRTALCESSCSIVVLNHCV